MAEVVILGGHGAIAQLLTPKLVAAGHEVTSVIRKEEQADTIRELGAKPYILDLEVANLPDFMAVFSRKDAIIFSAGAGGGSESRTYAIDLDAAERAMSAAHQTDVKRFLLVSYNGARRDHGVPEDDSFYAYAEAKSLADEKLQASELDWTLIGPGWLTDEPASGKVEASVEHEIESADGKGYTSRENVAEMIVAALDSDRTIGKFIQFTDGDTPIDEYIESIN